jgi:hypothetical protein
LQIWLRLLKSRVIWAGLKCYVKYPNKTDTESRRQTEKKGTRELEIVVM